MEVMDLKCPNCGAPQAIDADECEFCHSPVVIRTFRSVRDMPLPMLNKYVKSYDSQLSAGSGGQAAHRSAGICLLQLKLYDRALGHLEQAMEEDFDDTDLYLYAVCCLLGGRPPFLHKRELIERAESYLRAAIELEPKGIFYFLYAYIRYDYYRRRSLHVSPNYRELLDLSRSYKTSKADATELFDMLGQDFPADMMNEYRGG